MKAELIKSIFSDDPELVTFLERKERMKIAPPKDGRDGKDGIDGYTPIKGVDYFDGEDGESIKGEDGEDGKTPTRKELLALIKPLIPSVGLPELPAPIYETKIVKETLNITEQLVKDIIQIMHSLPEADKLEISKGLRNANSFIFNGTRYKTEELMHGAGSSSSTGITIIPISGTVDDVNETFTAPSQPTLLNINGAFYQQTGGAITWTYSGGTITLSSPVGSGGNIYGVV